MKSRLFRTIFWTFWLTFLLQLLLMGAVFTFLLIPGPGFARLAGEYSAQRELDLAVDLVRAGGVRALLSQANKARFSVTPWPSSEPQSDDRYARMATAAGGQRYRLTYRLPPQPGARGLIAPEIYLVGLVTGLLSAATLAFYLSRPIRSLKRGFEAFAAGALDTRLAHQMGRRRDEIADLARDFDGMADKIEQLVRSRDQLLDDVSHELRSPLARLQLAIALTRQNPARREDALDRIESEAARLDAMVGELLTLSRLESGAPFEQGYLDLTALLREIVADAAFEGQAHGVAVDFADRASEAMIEMPGNPELIRRVFENILRNALRFTPHGGVIELRVSRQAGLAVVEIEDSGPGVAPEQLATLFDRFIRGRNGGWGLGLAIAHRAVVAHHGTISARNMSVGLSVRVELPVGPSGMPGTLDTSAG